MNLWLVFLNPVTQRRVLPLLALLFPVVSLFGQTPSADLLLLNAHIVTMNDKQPSAQAVAIHGDRIVWIGNSDQSKKLYPAARTIDLHGATVLPGLIDAHTHLINLGESLTRLNLKDISTEKEMVVRVKQRVASAAPGEWIVGWGWDEGKWASNYPTNQALSAATPNNPVFLVVDGKGNVWFTDPTHNAIGKLVPSANTWTEWVVPTANAAPYDLVLDKNGNLWFTEILGNSIGYFNTTTLTFVETPTPSKSSGPYGITRDALGNIWFTENSLPQIGMFKPKVKGTGIVISEFAIGSGTNAPTPHLLTVDSTGNIWYSEGFAGQVGKYDPVNKTHQDYPVSAGVSQTHISGIGVDSHGMVWFNDSLSARIGTLNPTTGTVSAIQLTFAGAHPHDGLLVDKSNNVWITEQYGYNLGEVLP